MSKAPEKKRTSSPDYPRLAREVAERSGDMPPSKPGLYVVATPIGHLGDITLRALVTLMQADVVTCEDTRVSGALLAKYGIKKPLLPYHDHNAASAGPKILEKIASGAAVALISDAGMPLISDPGYRLVSACREAGYPVTVIPGANAALTALAGSGLPTDAFHFTGFLPAKSAARQKAIAGLKMVLGTLVFYEAPQRLAAMLDDLAKGLGKERPAAVARELTKLFEETRRGTLGELADFYRDHEVKGEITVLVGPAQESRAENAANIDELLKQALHTESLRDAAAAVSEMTGVKKSDVYARALKLKGKGRS
jgi:16S rRNA (cytidine1402-2'-O)-methyltransferase